MSLSFFVGIVTPVIFMGCSIFIKKISREGKTWEIKDFFLGMELTLGSVTTSMVYFFDILKEMEKTSKKAGLSEAIAANAVFLVLSFFLLFGLICVYQQFDIDPRPRADEDTRRAIRKNQLIWLAIISNAVGFALFFAFIVAVKGLS